MVGRYVGSLDSRSRRSNRSQVLAKRCEKTDGRTDGQIDATKIDR